MEKKARDSAVIRTPNYNVLTTVTDLSVFL